MYQNSSTATQNSKKFLGIILWTPVLGERKDCFRSPTMYQNSYSNAEFKNYPRNNHYPDLCFRGKKSSFSFSKKVPKLSYSNAEFKKKIGDRTPGPPFLGRGGES